MKKHKDITAKKNIREISNPRLKPKCQRIKN